ncbi:MAG: hypothetical protein ACOYLO_00755 [Ferruginibacter sp.]
MKKLIGLVFCSFILFGPDIAEAKHSSILPKTETIEKKRDACFKMSNRSFEYCFRGCSGSSSTDYMPNLCLDGCNSRIGKQYIRCLLTGKYRETYDGMD